MTPTTHKSYFYFLKRGSNKLENKWLMAELEKKVAGAKQGVQKWLDY